MKNTFLTFLSLSVFFRHIVEKHDKPTYLCGKCGKLLSTSVKLREHMKRHNPEEVCDKCGKVFASVSQLRDHVLAIHTEGKDKPHQCMICNKGFSRKQRLDQHINVHNKSQPLQCRYCDKRFNAYTNRTVHEKKYHEEAMAQATPKEKKETDY